MKKIHFHEVLSGSHKFQKICKCLKFFNESKKKIKYIYGNLFLRVNFPDIFWFLYYLGKYSNFYIFLETFIFFIKKNVVLNFDFDFFCIEKICSNKCFNIRTIYSFLNGKKVKKISNNIINKTGFFFYNISIKNLILGFLISKFFKSVINIKLERFFKRNLFNFHISRSSKNIIRENFLKKSKKANLSKYQNIFRRILEFKNFHVNYFELKIEKPGFQTSIYEKEINLYERFRILTKKVFIGSCFFGNYERKKKFIFKAKAIFFLKFLKNKKLILKKKQIFNFKIFSILQFYGGMFLFNRFEPLNNENNFSEIRIFYSNKFISTNSIENNSINFGKKYKHERNIDIYELRKKRTKNFVFSEFLFFLSPKNKFPIFLDKLLYRKNLENDDIVLLFSFFEKKKIFENFFVLHKKSSEERKSGFREIVRAKTLKNFSRSRMSDWVFYFLNFLRCTRDFEYLNIFVFLNIFRHNLRINFYFRLPQKKILDRRISKKNKHFFKTFNFFFLINRIFFRDSYN